MTVIGITGPSGAGKTTVLGVLEKMGATVIDCDAVYHRLLAERVRFWSGCGSGLGRLSLTSPGRWTARPWKRLS